MKNPKKFFSLDGSLSSSQVNQRSGVPKNGSHRVTLAQPKQKEIINLYPYISTEVHLTVRISNSSLTRKHFRLLLETLLFEVVHQGITLERYLMMEHLMSILLGAKTDSLELKDENERRLCLLTQIIMRALRGKEFTSGDALEILPEEISHELDFNDLLMNERTYNSRRVLWKPEKYLSILSVSVDTLIERSGNTERYSSYCKGYGESHPSAHYKKTPPSFELDGEDLREPKDLSLKEIAKLLILNQLDIRLKFSRKS